MKNILALTVAACLLFAPNIYSQKGKNKGGGNNTKIKVDIKNDNTNIKIKSDGKNNQLKINVKSKNDKIKVKDNYSIKSGKIKWIKPGGGHGDFYHVHGKPRHVKIKSFNNAMVRIDVNIGLLFGLLGDVRIKLDDKLRLKKITPERHKKLKLEIGLLETDLKAIEIKKNKLKIKLGKMK